MLAFVRRGDTVIVESISRLARNTKDLLSIVDLLQSKGADFISQKEAIDTTTPQGKFMLTVFSAMAELERESILERQREGIALAKENGVYTISNRARSAGLRDFSTSARTGCSVLRLNYYNQ